MPDTAQISMPNNSQSDILSNAGFAEHLNGYAVPFDLSRFVELQCLYFNWMPGLSTAYVGVVEEMRALRARIKPDPEGQGGNRSSS